MEKEFLTFKEAAKLTKVSSMTIRRLAYQWLKNPNPEISENVIVLNHKNPTGKLYKIAKGKVLKHFGVTDGKEQVKGKVKASLPKVKGPSTFRLKTVVNALEKSNDLLIEQLRVKDRQLEARDIQIKDLSERLRESHILLLGQPKSEPEPTVFEYSDVEKEEKGEGESAPAPEPEAEQVSEEPREVPEVIHASGPRSEPRLEQEQGREANQASGSEEKMSEERNVREPKPPKRGLLGWFGR